MANAIKLIPRGNVLTQAEPDDKQVCLSSSGDDSAQDLADLKTALDVKLYDPITVADAAARRNASSYPDGAVEGITQVVQSDEPNVVYYLIAADVTQTSSWRKMIDAADGDDFLVSLELADADGTVPDANVLSVVGKHPTIGDGVTTGGNQIALASDLPSYTTLVSTTGVVTGYYLNAIPNSWKSSDATILVAELGGDVTSLGIASFNSCEFLKRVKLSPRITVIPADTFGDCLVLEKINIPHGVTTIGVAAFSATAISEISIPSSVVSIGDTAFLASAQLATIYSYTTKTVWNAATNALASTASPLTIHARATDTTWTAGTGLTVSGNTNVTVIKDL